VNNSALSLVLVFAVLGLPGATRARADPGMDAAGAAAFRQGAFAEAYADWTISAQAGDGRAARYLGVLYDTGEGVHQDRARAFHWYERAAALGDAGGMFNMAVSYDAGTGTEQNRAEAARWYGRAAALHHGRAEYNLALMYEAGDGVPRDPAKARLLFEAAAHDGIAAATAHLPASQRVAVAMQPAGADTIFLQAQRALLSRTPQDAISAVALFRQAASRNDPAAPLAQYDLAWCYENGIGVQADPQQARALYLRAAAEAHEPGLRDLAQAGAKGVEGSTTPTDATETVLASRAAAMER